MSEEKRKKNKQYVFYISAAVSLFIVLAGALHEKAFAEKTNFLLNFISENFAWAYLTLMLAFVIFCLWLAFGRFGSIRLGPDDCEPEHSSLSWFAMLFCAGMGVGLVFWGISEPLSHYASPAAGIQPGSEAAAEFAIRSSFMHWGVHPWAAYGVVGIGLAYFQFRKNSPGLISSLFTPMLGEKGVQGPAGKAIDIFSAIVTVAGVAASLGMGTLQICAGLNYLYGLPNNATIWLTVIIIICGIYLTSAVSGLNKGMKLLSNFNLILAGIFVAAAFLLGPSGRILEILTSGVGDYAAHFVTDSLGLAPFGDNSWVLNWRVFYWAWWISWAPFVGVFIARISKGRTIREFVLGVIAVPSAASILWFSVFGGVALDAAQAFPLDELRKIAAVPETALFAVLSEYPLGTLLSITAIILLLTFFITSGDSATFVLGMLTDGGNTNPPNHKKIAWGILQAAIAYVLLITGGIKSLQIASIVAAFPFAFIMALICVNLIKELKKEGKS